MRMWEFHMLMRTIFHCTTTQPLYYDSNFACDLNIFCGKTSETRNLGNFARFITISRLQNLVFEAIVPLIKTLMNQLKDIVGINSGIDKNNKV